jgi:hypothetical protein
MIIFLMTVILGNTNTNADDLILDPALTKCALESNSGALETNIYFDNMQVHQGRHWDDITVKGDLIKCQSLLRTAKSLNQSLILKRELDQRGANYISWESKGFLTISGESKCNY